MRFDLKYTAETLQTWREVLARHDSVAAAVAEIGVPARSLHAAFKRAGEYAGQWLKTPHAKRPGKPPAPDAKRWMAVRPFASADQQRAIDSLLLRGSVAAAAAALELTPKRLRALLAEAEFGAARAGWSPAHDMTKPVPDGFHVKGVSTYYGKDGEKRGQWVKSKRDQESRLEALLDAVQHLAEPFRGAIDPVKPPEHTNTDLLTVYPFGDPHIGMYAWAEETGASFDLEIAERNLVAAVDQLVALAPPSSLAYLLNLGDFFHTDNASNQTARSGNVLDVDTRWPKVYRAGVRTIRRCVERALEKHDQVYLANVPGNHDDHSAAVLSVCMSLLYESNPRVKVELSPAAFYYLRFGRCLIGTTHGDNVKASDLPGIMASDRAADWGETRYRHWYTGHVHHDSLKEYRGVTVETVRTLAAGDAWHARSGYRSGRDMKLDVWHKQLGHINRHIVGIEQLTGGAG